MGHEAAFELMVGDTRGLFRYGPADWSLYRTVGKYDLIERVVPDG